MMAISQKWVTAMMVFKLVMPKHGAARKKRFPCSSYLSLALDEDIGEAIVLERKSRACFFSGGGFRGRRDQENIGIRRPESQFSLGDPQANFWEVSEKYF